MISVKEQTYQWNRIESPKVDTHNCSQLIPDNKQRQYNGAESASSSNSAGITRHPYLKQININTDILPLTKFNFKWIIDLNIKHKTGRLMEDIIEGKPK